MSREKEFKEIFGGEPDMVKKPSGFIIVDGQEVGHTLQCAHCQKHWIVIKGSGKIRGFCELCKKVTCGNTKCLKYHAPKEAILDFQDGGGTDKHAKVQKKLMEMFPGIERLAT